MKITMFWLMIIPGLSLAELSLPAQEPSDSTSIEAVEGTSDNEATEDNKKDGDELEATAEASKEVEAETEAEDSEKTWQGRLVPSVAVSAQEPAPEVVVGEPSAFSGETDGKKVYLPYPPRPHTPLPPGWVLRPSDDLRPIMRNVVLADGRHLTLEFPSMELQPAPATDGSLAMQEPGFDPRKSTQENTISHTLTQFINDTTKHRDVLGEALREMEQIFLSAPAAPRRPRLTPAPTSKEPSTPLLPPSPPTQ